jgi:hypothetical protein
MPPCLAGSYILAGVYIILVMLFSSFFLLVGDKSSCQPVSGMSGGRLVSYCTLSLRLSLCLTAREEEEEEKGQAVIPAHMACIREKGINFEMPFFFPS